jgi:hypothetical protein
MSVKSANNLTNTPLLPNRIFVGSYDSVLPYSTAVFTVSADKDCEVILYSSADKLNQTTTTYTTVGGVPFIKVVNITQPFVYFTIRNTTQTAQTYLHFDVIYREVSVATASGGVGSNVNIFDSNGDSLNSTSGALDVFLTNTLTISGDVSVDNFPATQAVSGSVDVDNFPASFEVSNFPATQAVSGSVDVDNFPASFEVSNFPATQTVSGTVDVGNFPTSTEVSNFPATQTVSGTVDVGNFPASFEVSNFPATQAVSGSVDVDNFPASFEVSNFPTTQPVSIYSRVSLPVWSGTTVNTGDVSTAVSFNDFNATTLSVYGSATVACTLAVQFSYEGTTFYTTQYSVAVGTGEDFGFTIQSASAYVRVKRIDAGAESVVNVVIEGC